MNKIGPRIFVEQQLVRGDSHRTVLLHYLFKIGFVFAKNPIIWSESSDFLDAMSKDCRLSLQS